MILGLLDGAFDDIMQGNLQITSVSDLERIVKLNMLIDGEATERRETTVLTQTEDEYKNLSRVELEKILEAEYEETEKSEVERKEGNSVKALGEGFPSGIHSEDASEL